MHGKTQDTQFSLVIAATSYKKKKYNSTLNVIFCLVSTGRPHRPARTVTLGVGNWEAKEELTVPGLS